MFSRRQKQILVLLGIALGILLIIGIIISATPRGSLKVTISPQSVTFKIDKQSPQSVKNGDTLSLQPGTHMITVSRSGFATGTEQVTIKNHQTTAFLLVLTPETYQAQQLVLDNTDQQIIQEYSNKVEQKQVHTLTSRYPILNDLPISSDHYLINSCPSQKYPNDPTKIALCIQEDSTAYNTAALWAIQNAGYNPNDFEIIWQPVDTSSVNNSGD